MSILANEQRWILCPRCGAKTRLKLFSDTELKHFPLFCPKCKTECVIDAKGFEVKTISIDQNQPDAKTQC